MEDLTGTKKQMSVNTEKPELVLTTTYLLISRDARHVVLLLRLPMQECLE
jgi:hypothetical protein